MSTQVQIPTDLWDEDEEAVITAWLASDGAGVTEGGLIVEIMVAKTQFEIHAPATGTLKILKAADDVVAKGGVIAEIA